MVSFIGCCVITGGVTATKIKATVKLMDVNAF